MVKRLTFIVFGLLIGAIPVWANHTRMATLMAGDYIDDIIYTDTYPQRLLEYANQLFLDIRSGPEDFGLAATPNPKYGVIACWQNPVSNHGFNIGYAVRLYDFDIGFSLSPVEENTGFGAGVGRTFFDQRVDVSFQTFDGIADKWNRFTIRYARRMSDYNLIPRYSFEYTSQPLEYGTHTIGAMVQRLIMNEGFVYFSAEYANSYDAVEYDSTRIHAGVELKLTRLLVLRCGIAEHFAGRFKNGQSHVEPGIGLRIRDFSIDLHFNKDRFFDKEQTFFNSAGLDFKFGKF